MTEPLLVGVDVGTSACKAVVLTADGTERSRGAQPTPWTALPAGAQTQPEALLSAALGAAGKALDDAPPGRVAGVGVASMAETGVLLDGAGRPLLPAIAWNDRRGMRDAESMAVQLGADEVAGRTGLAVGPKLTAVKYRWLRRHQVQVAAGRRWLSVAEWIVHAIGGEAVAEPSLASRTGWLDLDRCAWWPESVAWSGIVPQLLPDLRPAGKSAGHVRSGLGRLAGAVLTVAGHDHQSAAVGAGATGPGDVLDSCGTAEAFVRAVAPVDATVRQHAMAMQLSVARHVLPNRMAVIGGFRSGDRLQRLLQILDVADRETLDASAAVAHPPVPALTVEDLDRLTEDAGGQAASPSGLWRGAAEAVARHGAEVLEHLEALTSPRRRLVVVGGWASSTALMRAKETLLGPLVRPAVAEPGARGAALFAGVAAGLFDDVEAVATPAGALAGVLASGGGRP
ncbi:MAG: FGGY family carbohydrate kinase [Actinomycetota bacterium]|nr:FGGY family carbohydrate kinase [Actinomycetota bacterium]